VQEKGLEMVETKGLVLIGIAPTYPATGYGYIQSQEGYVQTFHEKPEVEKAKQLLLEKALWNAGVCIVNIQTLEQLFRQLLPACIEQEWCDQPSISFDYAILEKASDIQVLCYDGWWSDLGDWDSVANHLPRVDDHQIHSNVVFSAVESQRCVVVSHQPIQVSIVGLDDIVVVHGTEGLLIMKRGMAQKVRQIQPKT